MNKLLQKNDGNKTKKKIILCIFAKTFQDVF